MLVGLGLVAAVLLVALLGRVDLGLPTLASALLVVVVTSIATRRSPVGLARNVSWSILVLVAGLFVMVAAVESIGAIDVAARGVAWATAHGNAGSALVAGVVGIGNNVVNNLPLGLVAGVTVKAAHPLAVLTPAVLIGVDLGPNLAVTGQTRDAPLAHRAPEERIDVGFQDYLRVGAIVMPAGLVAALAGLLAMNALQR